MLVSHGGWSLSLSPSRVAPTEPATAYYASRCQYLTSKLAATTITMAREAGAWAQSKTTHKERRKKHFHNTPTRNTARPHLWSSSSRSSRAIQPTDRRRRWRRELKLREKEEKRILFWFVDAITHAIVCSAPRARSQSVPSYKKCIVCKIRARSSSPLGRPAPGLGSEFIVFTLSVCMDEFGGCRRRRSIRGLGLTLSRSTGQAEGSALSSDFPKKSVGDRTIDDGDLFNKWRARSAMIKVRSSPADHSMWRSDWQMMINWSVLRRSSSSRRCSQFGCDCSPFGGFSCIAGKKWEQSLFGSDRIDRRQRSRPRQQQRLVEEESKKR